MFASSIYMATSEHLEDPRNDDLYKEVFSRSVELTKNLDFSIEGDKSEGRL